MSQSNASSTPIESPQATTPQIQRDFVVHDDGVEWAVSRVLGGVLSTAPRASTFQGARVLEFGSGLGHLAVRTAGLGAMVTATERGRELATLNARVAAAGASLCAKEKVEVLQCDWGEEWWTANPDSVATILARGPFDFILMSELYYDEDVHDDLLWTLIAVCSANQAHPVKVYSGFKNRPYSLQFLASLHDTEKFDVKPIPDAEIDLLGVESSPGDEVLLHTMDYRPDS